MNTCGSCKYKGEEILKDDPDKDEIFYSVKTGYFLCERIKHRGHRQDFKAMPSEGAVSVDGSGYYAALCVESDFGCVKWEKADD